ncbi:MAG: 3-keto-5-aminohexanoate cleavage protein, partial [Spirochaetales bacterium]|nr:3-keto-5-aminohexanoate cleavage protein [Spirochaetales bacterium]
MTPLIITAAICGAEVSRQDNPALPLTPEELAIAAKECQDAGASIIHLHVRDAMGAPTQSREVFQRAMSLMKEHGVRAIIQPSTGGAVGMSVLERMQPLFLFPEMATLDCGSLNFGEDVFLSDFPTMRALAQAMKEQRVLPELECFEMGHVANALRLNKEGLLPAHLHFDLVLGVPGGMEARGENLFHALSQLPQDC